MVKVVRPIVSDSQQRGADGQHDEAAEEQQVEQSAERLLMNAFLCQRVNSEPLNPNPPITLKSARLTFAPEPHVGYDLPHEHTDTRRHHDEEHHLHPWRDVAEHFASGVVHVGRDHRLWRSGLGPANRFDKLRDDVMQVTHQAVSRHLKNRGVGIFVDRDDDPRILDARQMLDRAGDAKRDVQLGRDDLAGLSDLIIVGGHACVDCRAGGTDCAAQRVR